MNKKLSLDLIKKTRDDYNKISTHFSSTRKYNWPEVADAIEGLGIKKDDKVLDLGCGNGRLFEALEKYDIDYYGLDISEELVKIAKKTYPKGNFIASDLLKTPYKDNEFDVIASIATLHHIPSKKLRREALKEVYRIAKPGGKILISIWYFWNKPNYLGKILKSAIKRFYQKDNLEFGDFYSTWKTGKGEILAERYFHAWTKNELINNLKNIGFKKIKEINAIFLKRNLTISCKKPFK
jgi:ubiquinone/menaquinone biosynthesis C-methylase UbiE